MRFVKWLPALLVLTASLAKGQKSPESDVLIITNVEVVDTRQGLTSPILNGGKPYEYTITTSTPQEARNAVDKLADEHVDFIKVLSELSRETYFAIAEETRKQKLTFAGHVPESISTSEASAAGQRSIE